MQKFLSINPYSRPQKPLHELKAVVMHWTEAPQQNEYDVWNFFESRKNGNLGYGSAHYIIGQNGNILQCIPENEVAYHCGSDKKDPLSNKVYTDYARELFGKYCSYPETLSPNLCTIGIELCPLDSKGTFSNETIYNAVQLVASILKRNGLTADAITTHNEIVGWKNCPKAWVMNPELLRAFKIDVGLHL